MCYFHNSRVLFNFHLFLLPIVFFFFLSAYFHNLILYEWSLHPVRTHFILTSHPRRRYATACCFFFWCLNKQTANHVAGSVVFVSPDWRRLRDDRRDYKINGKNVLWNENRQAGWQQTEWKQDELTFHCNNPKIQTIIWLFHDFLVSVSRLFLFIWIFIPWCFD